VSAPNPPVIRVVRGNPTTDELAALVVVLTAGVPGDESAAAPKTPSGWSAYWRATRAPLSPGPGAWRSSGRPG